MTDFFVSTWEQRKFKNIMVSIPYREYLKVPVIEGRYIIVQQGDQPIIGYANGEPFRDIEKITLFGDHTLSLFKPQSPFFVATDAVKILYSENMYGPYFYNLLERYKPQSQGYKRHFTILKESTIFSTTDNNEQILIATIFETLEKTITLHHRK